MAQVSQVLYVLIFIRLLTLLVFPNSKLLMKKCHFFSDTDLIEFQVSTHDLVPFHMCRVTMYLIHRRRVDVPSYRNTFRINLLKTKHRLLYLKTRAVNTFNLGYKNQSVYAVSDTSRSLFSDKYKTHKYSVGRAYSC